MAETLVNEVPGVEQATRIAPFWGAPTLRYEDKAFTEEKMFYADSNFFNFFTFRLLQGDPETALLEPYSAVLTKSVAAKYFGDGNGLGKLVVIGGDKRYKVTGITADAPLNSHFIYHVLLSSSSAEHLQNTNWLNNCLHTYFILVLFLASRRI
jgi:putative ABC transport system permease protein